MHVKLIIDNQKRFWLFGFAVCFNKSHTSKFSNTFCCKSHKGEVYFKKHKFYFDKVDK